MVGSMLIQRVLHTHTHIHHKTYTCTRSLTCASIMYYYDYYSYDYYCNSFLGVVVNVRYTEWLVL
jgi:hypothetical protein